MAQTDITHAFDDPIVRVVLGSIGLVLTLVCLRQVRRIPARLLVLMATAFLDMVGLLMIVPLLPFYVQKLGGDGVTLLGMSLGIGSLTAVIVSAFTLAQLISSPLWGRFSDRFGRRPALLIAMGASAIAYLIFGFAESLWVLFLSRLVQGAGGGTVGVIQAYVADTTAPEDRARSLGWLSAATNLGVALGPVLGTLAIWIGTKDLMPGEGVFKMGHPAPGIFAALLCAVTMAFAARHLTESNVAPKADAPRRSSRQAIWHVIRRAGEPSSRLIWTYAIAIGAFQGINAVMALFLNARFRVTEAEIGWFYMYIGAISVFARVLLLGPLVDRLGEIWLSRVGIVTLAAGVCGMPLAGSLPTLALAVAMIPLGTAFTFPCVTSLLSRVIAPTERGLYMGMQQTFGGLARIVAPLFYGWAFDHVGIESPFYVAAAVVLATVMLGFGLGPVARPRAAAAPGSAAVEPGKRS